MDELRRHQGVERVLFCKQTEATDIQSNFRVVRQIQQETGSFSNFRIIPVARRLEARGRSGASNVPPKNKNSTFSLYPEH